MLRWLIRQPEATVIGITILTIIYFALRTSALFTVDNTIVTFQYVAPFIVIGAGEVLMLVLAEIDLSAGQVYLTAPWFVYWFWSAGVPVGLAIIIALVLSAVIGLVNGLITVWLRVPSLIVTLAMTFLLYGLVLVGSSYTQEQMTWTKGTPPAAPVQTPPCHGYPLPAACLHAPSWAHPSPYFVLQQYPWHRQLGHHPLGPVVLALIWFLLKHTRFGVHTTATGGNILAAAEAGIPVARVKNLVLHDHLHGVGVHRDPRPDQAREHGPGRLRPQHRAAADSGGSHRRYRPNRGAGNGAGHLDRRSLPRDPRGRAQPHRGQCELVLLARRDHHHLRHGPQRPTEPVSNEAPKMSTAS